MARPKGSENKDKPFRDALRMVIADAEDNPRKLRKIAEALYDQAAGGDVSAIKEIGDRLDGKVAQAVVGGNEDDPAIQLVHRIERIIVRPPDPNG